jgi:hypothetical protein
MNQEIASDKRLAIARLKAGLEEECADHLTEVMINLEDGTCDYLELVPVLEEIAHVEWFYYFDDNGAGGLPHADIRQKTSFKSWALDAIENIRENARIESSSMIHHALKSNSTVLIKSTLDQLKAQNRITDLSLLPILEKIVRKNVYKKYSYIGGFETDCHLGELAREIIQIIVHPSRSVDLPDKTSSIASEYPAKCSVCYSLPDDITVNTGREEYFPAAFSQLIGMDNEYRAEFRYCPGCRIVFNWIDMSQMYGSGNNDEERLVRLSPEKSRLLDKLFNMNTEYQHTSTEIEEYIGSLSIDLLVPALRFNLYQNHRLISPFVPSLLQLLGKNNDSALWDLLRAYVSDNPDRAEAVMDICQRINAHKPDRLKQLLEHCLKLLNGKR